MNKLNFQGLRKHPIKTVGATASLTALVAIITLKIIHNAPLNGLEERYLEDLKSNEYSLGPISEKFFRVNPKSLLIIKISDDTIIVQDIRNLMTFTLTCPGGGDHYEIIMNDGKVVGEENLGSKEESGTELRTNGYCLLRDDPQFIPLTGTVFGKGEVISRKSAAEILNRAMNPGVQNM